MNNAFEVIEDSHGLEGNALGSAEAWHIIRVPMDKVVTSITILKNLGLGAWAPFETRWVRQPRSALRVRKKPVEYPAFFNYLFVGIMNGNDDWLAMFRTGYILALVVKRSCVGLEPALVPKDTIEKAVQLQAEGKFKPKSFIASLKRDIELGGNVRVLDERHPWWGHTMRIQAVKDDAVCVTSEILGRKVELEIGLDAIELAS